MVPRPVSNPERVFLEHLPLIERSVTFVVRRYHASPAETDDFASHVRLKLVEDDYALLRTLPRCRRVPSVPRLSDERLGPVAASDAAKPPAHRLILAMRSEDGARAGGICIVGVLTRRRCENASGVRQ